MMTITWMGHACFLLESGGYRVLLDPFKGVRGYPDTAPGPTPSTAATATSTTPIPMRLR